MDHKYNSPIFAFGIIHRFFELLEEHPERFETHQLKYVGDNHQEPDVRMAFLDEAIRRNPNDFTAIHARAILLPDFFDMVSFRIGIFTANLKTSRIFTVRERK